jgi:hypothetical protein
MEQQKVRLILIACRHPESKSGKGQHQKWPGFTPPERPKLPRLNENLSRNRSNSGRQISPMA